MTEKKLTPEETPLKRQPGRPRKADDEVQGRFLTMRVNEALMQAVKERGGSRWAREALLDALRRSGGVLSPGIKPETIQIPSEKSSEAALPRLDLRAACGFPAPAAESETEETDLYDLLVPKPGKTILVEASSDSMVDAGIYEGDLLIVEVSSEARSGQIVLVCYDGNFLVKRLKVIDGRPELRSENDAVNYPVLKPRPTEQFVIEGIVRHVIRSFR